MYLLYYTCLHNYTLFVCTAVIRKYVNICNVSKRCHVSVTKPCLLLAYMSSQYIVGHIVSAILLPSH